jgi:hypothetical protein
LRSGTSGFSRTIARGSGRGTPGTSTSPAPSRPRPEEDAVEPELRTDTERPVDRPDNDRDSRPETERRDCEERDDVRELAREPPRTLLLSEPPAPRAEEPDDAGPATPALPGREEPGAGSAGASPQVSQYSSPPPMSS